MTALRYTIRSTGVIMDTEIRAGLRFFLLAAPETQAIGKEESRGTELQIG